MDEAVDWLRKQFQSSAAEGLEAVFEYVVSGDSGGVLHFRVDDGMLDVRRGPGKLPDVRFRVSDEDCWAVFAGNENADLLYLGGRLEIEGSLSLALKLRSLFRAPV
jgi:predicted lipid carrier protein YhbT